VKERAYARFARCLLAHSHPSRATGRLAERESVASIQVPPQPTRSAAGSPKGSRRSQANKVQGGAASLSCFIISDAAIAAPCSAKSCSRSPQRMNRHRGRSQPKRGEPLFEPSNPPSSRASRVRAGVEPRRLL